MTGYEIAVFAAKLGFGIAAFLLIGYLGGSSDRRVAGLMLTFPVLNGIGLLTTPDKDPYALTIAMMPIIALNGILVFGFIVAFRSVRQSGAKLSDNALSYSVAAAGAAVWFAVCALLMPAVERSLPERGWIAAIYLAAAAMLTLTLWSAPTGKATASPGSTSFIAFWRRRSARVAFFVISMFALLVAAEFGSASWIGRLSALPLVPLCVLAGLAVDEPDALPALRDPILLGPGLAMLFVLPFTAILGALQAYSRLSYWVWGTTTLIAGWALYFALIRYGAPAVTSVLDRWRRQS